MHADKEGNRHDYALDWTLESGESVDLKEISAGKLGGSFTITKTLPERMLETDAVYFSTSNLRFKVYVSGDEIYAFDTEENMTGTGDGVSYHMIGLGTKDQGDEMRIEAETVFADRVGGRINDMQFGPEDLYRHHVMRRNLAGFGLSVLLVIFGIVVLAFYFGMAVRNEMLRSVWGLGLSAILFGVWSLCDTGLPQMLTGSTYACREVVYGLTHFASFPLFCFISGIMRTRRKVYPVLSFLISFLCLGCLLISRYAFGIDLHTMTIPIYISYISQLVLLLIMLIDNELWCRRNGKPSELRFFYLGSAFFVLTSFIDIFRYMIEKKGSIGHGSFCRLGLVVFFIFLAFHTFDWWSSEKTSLERDRFINHLLQYVMDTENPETKISKVIEYLCMELHADRAYIFEDMNDGTFDNTYEFCAEGVTPEIDNLKGIPYEGIIDVWYNEYKKGGHILIYDIEKYKEVSKNMYDILKPQGINTLVTGPLILDDKYIGFFGVDNPPAEAMNEISEIIKLLTYFLSEMIGQRDSHKRLMEYSYHDSMTGVGNRRAIKDFEKEELDTSRSYGFVMCDINGLKAVNDSKGHEAGDEMIKAVSDCLSEVFGAENVYRMGGDEFAVYAYEDSRRSFDADIDKIRSMVNERGIHVAIGYSFAESGDSDYHAHRIEADNRMYDEKREFYRDGNDRRKGTGDI